MSSGALECPHGETCGACAFLGMGYSAQMLRKRRTLRAAFQKFRSLADVEILDCLESPVIEAYRNRAKMAVGISKWRPPSLGYFQPGSREIEDAPECQVLEPAILETTRALRKLLQGSASIPKTLRHVDVRCGSDSRRQHLTLVLRTKELPDLPIDRIRKACRRVDGISVNLNPSKGPQVIKGPIQHLWGSREIWVDVGKFSLRVSPGSFFQVNLAVLPQIHQIMAEFFGQGDSLADLYSGVGTHGFALSRQFRRVLGVEGVRSSVADAKATIKRYKLSHMQVFPKPVERSLEALKHAQADCVIMNPSRAGAKPAVLDMLIASPARKIAYLSCEPETLSQDIDVLIRNGFKLVSAQPIDMMPQTRQVEAIVLLSR